MRKLSKFGLSVLGLIIALTTINPTVALAANNPTLVMQGQYFRVSAIESNVDNFTPINRGMKISITLKVNAQFSKFVFPSTLDDCMSGNATGSGYFPEC